MAWHGLTVAEREQLIEAQGNVCAICERKFGQGRSASLDHRHHDGLVRGYLCTRCNDLLGEHHENAALFRAAADYLEAPPAIEVLGRRYTPGSPGAAGHDLGDPCSHGKWGDCPLEEA